jgi:tetratricopeptide (TPR) repeat protein
VRTIERVSVVHCLCIESLKLAVGIVLSMLSGASAIAQGSARDDLAREPFMVDAVRVRLTGGREFVGLPMGERCATTWVYLHGAEIPIANSLIESANVVRVDALTVGSADVVLEYLRRSNPLANSNDWLVLARAAEGLFLFADAKECLEQLLAEEPDYADAALVLKRIAEFAAKLEQDGARSAELREIEPVPAEPEALELMTKINRFKSQLKYEDAIDVVYEFYSQYSDTDLRDEVAKKLAEIVEARWKARVAIVQTEFLPAARRLCESRATDTGGGIEAAAVWAREKCFAETLQSVAKKHGLDGECEASLLWRDRKTSGSGSPANYGAGTFVLQWDSDNAKLQRVEPNPDAWWRDSATTTAQRAAFLFAYFCEYAEYEGQSGLMIVSTRTSVHCSTCAGVGKIRYQNTQANKGPSGGSVPCPRCKGLGADRAINAK